ARRHGEVMAALAADVERLLELVLAVVRVAARAGVRVPLTRGLLRGSRLLDGDVDAARHGTSEFRPRLPRRSYSASRTSARPRRSGSSNVGFGSPVSPSRL